MARAKVSGVENSSGSEVWSCPWKPTMILYFWAYLSTRGATLTFDDDVMYLTPSACAAWKPRSIS